MNFEFTTPSRIILGEGRLRDVAGLAATLGTRALVVEGKSSRGGALGNSLVEHGLTATTVRVDREPTTSLIEQLVAEARDDRSNVIIALGGGSVIDAGKAIAALLTNTDPVLDYLEVVGKGKPLTNRPAPFIAIPTTAGTGAEATRNAVLMVEDARVKVSLRSPLMLPAVAVIDPTLTYTMPPNVTASTGLDALTQCIEPFLAPQANPLSDAVAREGMRRAAGALRRAYRDGSDVDARRDMAIASLCSGLALANAKLGAVHGFAAPLCGMFPIPHGVACARLLPLVVDANVRALRSREPHSPAVDRFHEVARLITGDAAASIDDGVEWLRLLGEELSVPGFGTFGMNESDIPRVVSEARRASSMQGNPIVLTDDELSAILGLAL